MFMDPTNREIVFRVRVVRGVLVNLLALSGVAGAFAGRASYSPGPFLVPMRWCRGGRHPQVSRQRSPGCVPAVYWLWTHGLVGFPACVPVAFPAVGPRPEWCPGFCPSSVPSSAPLVVSFLLRDRVPGDRRRLGRGVRFVFFPASRATCGRPTARPIVGAHFWRPCGRVHAGPKAMHGMRGRLCPHPARLEAVSAPRAITCVNVDCGKCHYFRSHRFSSVNRMQVT